MLSLVGEYPNIHYNIILTIFSVWKKNLILEQNKGKHGGDSLNIKEDA